MDTKDKIVDLIVDMKADGYLNDAIADAILALEVTGRLKCTYKSNCNFRKKGICYKADSRWPNPDCEDQRPATIQHLIDG